MLTCRTLIQGAIEFLDDPTDWPPLELHHGGLIYAIQAPISGYYHFHPAAGQEPEWLLKAAYQPFGLTFFTVMIDVSLSEFDVRAIQVLVANIGAWIRAITRQYWIGKQPHSTLQIPAYQLVQNDRPHHSGGGVNVFRYGRPLARTDWEALGLCNAGAALPDAALITFCDGLLAAGNGDWRQAVIHMASACDQEINFLIEQAFAERVPQITQLLKKRLRYEFSAGHSEIAAELGLQPFKDFDSEAAKRINELYVLRGQAIHRKAITASPTNLMDFVLAADRFLEWAQVQLARI
jgi:hypothetical protein